MAKTESRPKSTPSQPSKPLQPSRPSQPVKENNRGNQRPLNEGTGPRKPKE